MLETLLGKFSFMIVSVMGVRIFGVFVLTLLLSACLDERGNLTLSSYDSGSYTNRTMNAADLEAQQIDNVIRLYRASASTVSLGEPKAIVLSKLPDQSILGRNAKASEAFLKDNSKVEIYYFRTARIPDGRTTDDEVVPYVFINGKLAAIGWSALGGPKTAGDLDASNRRLNNLL